jgi:hypothetical protein
MICCGMRRPRCVDPEATHAASLMQEEMRMNSRQQTISRKHEEPHNRGQRVSLLLVFVAGLAAVVVDVSGLQLNWFDLKVRQI